MAKSKTCFRSFDDKPRAEYRSRILAARGVIEARRNYGHELQPYECRKCGWWHIGPPGFSARGSRPELCAYCTSAADEAKYCYSTRAEAETVAAERESRGAETLDVYPCEHGCGWHLTKA